MSGTADDKRVQIEDITEKERSRINRLLRSNGGEHVTWGAREMLDVWVAETRLDAGRLAAGRILVATWDWPSRPWDWSRRPLA